MKTKLFILLLAFLTFITSCDKKVSTDTEKIKVKPATDFEVLSQKLVKQVTNVKEGEIVTIIGGVRDIELLEDIFTNVQKVGGFSLITIGSDRMIKRYYAEVPAKYDLRTSELDLKLAQIKNVTIEVDFNESADLQGNLPSERLAAVNKAVKPVDEIIHKRNHRYVNLGNGFYPTEDLAKQYNIPLEQLSKMFWDGVNVDYNKLQSVAESFKNVLSTGKEIQITNSNGTDLKVRIEGKPVLVSDGVISDEEIKKGFPYSYAWLPAGEVYVSSVPGTAHGKVFIDKYFYMGKFIEGLELTFKDGKIISMTAKSGLEKLKAMFDAGDLRKDEFGFVDIGINPNITFKPGTDLLGFMMSGIVTIGNGNNLWAGGDNNSSFGVQYFLKGCTLKVDGKVLVENGVLKM